jgi:hypothetical protein
MAIAAATLLPLGTTGALAGDGVQFARDCTRTYVNKQVGENEQWAITWGIYGDATGNVFKLDGSAPALIECTLVAEDQANEIFDCFGADACTAPPCGGAQWTQIADDLAIPLTFFLPPGVDPLNTFDACTPADGTASAEVR